MQQTSSFLKLVRNPLRFRFFLLLRLPSAFFSGVRVSYVSESSCSTTVAYSWFSRNPFRSTYFACLAMAAEMSTGILAMGAVQHSGKPVSMLVTGLEAGYFKKAVGLTRFTCEQGTEIAKAVERAVTTGEAQTIRVRSVGQNPAGEQIAEFFITWSFKRKNV